MSTQRRFEELETSKEAIQVDLPLADACCETRPEAPS